MVLTYWKLAQGVSAANNISSVSQDGKEGRIRSGVLVFDGDRSVIRI